MDFPISLGGRAPAGLPVDSEGFAFYGGILKKVEANLITVWVVVAVAIVGGTGLAVYSPMILVWAALAVVALGSLVLPIRSLFRICAAVAILAVVGVPITRMDTAADGPLRWAAAAAIAFAAFALIVRGKGLALPARLWVPVTLLFAITAFSTSFMPDNKEWFTLGLTALVTTTGIMVASVGSRLKQLPFVWKTIVTVAAAQSIYAVYEMFATPEPLLRGAVRRNSDLINGFERAQGTFAHPLPLAFFLILASLVLICFVRVPRIAKLSIWISLGAGVAASGSRNAVIIFVLLSFLAYSRHRLLERLPLLGLALIAGVMLLWPLISAQAERLLDSGSVSHRLGAVSSLEPLVKERSLMRAFFGDGSASIPRLYESGFLQNDGLMAVDNQFVLTLAQDGILGLIVLMTLLLMAWRKSNSALKVILLAIVAEFMIFDLLGWPSSMFFAWFFVALAIMQPKQGRRGLRTESGAQAALPLPGLLR
jgi:hypothetical protein